MFSAAFVDMEKAYDMVEWNALQAVLKICRVKRQLLNNLKVFYRGANASVRVDGELNKIFSVHVGVGQWCDVTVAL